MSLLVSGDNVAGWAKYGDGTFGHFVGTKNSDGTFSVTAYTGETLSVSGNSMTATLDDGGGASQWTKTTQSDYAGAGGPSSSAG